MSALPAQSPIPIRQLTPAVHADSGAVASVNGVRHLPDGSVLVNDPVRRRVVAFDSTLMHTTVVLDSLPGTATSYGTQRGFIFPFVGDSTAFVDVSAQALIILDPSAHVVRTTALPGTGRLLSLTIASTFNAAETYDSRGRFIYRVYLERPNAAPAPPPRSAVDTMSVTVTHDSAVIMRVDLDAQRTDTLGFLALAISRSIEFRSTNMSVGYAAVDPIPLTDEWAVLSDGTIALVRGRDYHVDLVHPDGTKTSSPKLPFDWRRVTLEDKQRMLDSARKAFDDMLAKRPPPPARPPGSVASPGPRFYPAEPSDMADYYPPIRLGQLRADRDNNLWILPTTSAAAANGLLYDVVNVKGELVERVQLPPSRSLVGFGPGGVVYMTSFAAPGAPRLERARVIR